MEIRLSNIKKSFGEKNVINDASFVIVGCEAMDCRQETLLSNITLTYSLPMGRVGMH